MALSKDQVARYSRQLILPEIGVRGQERWLQGSVLVIGAGGLGSPAALYLAGAGVGTIGVIDADAVAMSNLHRQILHTASDIGRAKSASAQAQLTARNPDIRVLAFHERLTAANAMARLASFDLVVDGSDTFATRYLVNDACCLLGKPLVHGGVVHFGGQVMTILPGRSACFRCVFPEPPAPGMIPSCQEAGVLGSAAGVIGTLMAHEALKVLAGLGDPLTDRLLVFDGLTSRFREVPLRRQTACAVCGEAPTIHRLTEDVLRPTCPEEEPCHENR